MEKKTIFIQFKRYVNWKRIRSYIRQADSALTIGVVITILGCFFPMVARTMHGNASDFYGDFFGNDLLGTLGGLLYSCFSGDFDTATQDTIGVFVGTMKEMRSAGITLIAWGCATIFFLRKNKLVIGLLSSCQILFLNFILLYDFRYFKGTNGTHLYTTTEYTYELGHTLFIVGAILLLIGIIRTANAVKQDLSAVRVLSHGAKILFAVWIFTIFAFVLRKGLFKIVAVILFNLAGIYFLKPLLENKTESKESDNNVRNI